jgi:hypothetical protein
MFWLERFPVYVAQQLQSHSVAVIGTDSHWFMFVPALRLLRSPAAGHVPCQNTDRYRDWALVLAFGFSTIIIHSRTVSYNVSLFVVARVSAAALRSKAENGRAQRVLLARGGASCPSTTTES